MSADNHLYINKTETGLYQVWDMWEEQNDIPYEKQIPIAACETLESAINAAKDYQKEWPVEYGIQFGNI